MNKKLFLILIILSVYVVYPQVKETGTIKGIVTDKETKSPLIGCTVQVTGTNKGTTTDENGAYSIDKIPVGNYILRFSYIGYKPINRADIIVKSERITFENAELIQDAVESGEVSVKGAFFQNIKEQPLSLTSFSYEEIRRAPGAAGDVSRMIMSLPSISKVNDNSNSLIVRGGAPTENGFIIDNIEISNINHFPTQGSSGGPIGILNVALVRDLNFYSGAFNSKYGDKLSSIMEISFREGNREEFNGMVDLNWAGFGALLEGPLFSKKGSWLFSARRSYIDLLNKITGGGVAARYGDFQGKVTYDFSPTQKISLIGIFSNDWNRPEEEDVETYYGSEDNWNNTIGINWTALWSQNSYSNTSLSFSQLSYNDKYYEKGTGNLLIENKTTEQSLNIRNQNYFKINDIHSIELGFDGKYIFDNYDNYFGAVQDVTGILSSETKIALKPRTGKYGAFVNYIVNPVKRFTVTAGLRYEGFLYNKSSELLPRVSAEFRINEEASITASAGVYSQTLPFILLLMNDNNKQLKNPLAYHYVLGWNQFLSEDTKLTVELYYKEYKNFPMDESTPSLFILDELFYSYGFFLEHTNLNDKGKGFARGVEITIQKKLAKDVYGLISASYFKTRYCGLDGIWRDRLFDNRFTFAVEGGYKPNEEWEFSARWIYAGGTPYTPYNYELSKLNNAGIFDETKVNDARNPAYHSLNIRFDKRFHFSGSNLVCYLSIWNTYNRKNIAGYYWDKSENESKPQYQWSLLPIFGVEYYF